MPPLPALSPRGLALPGLGRGSVIDPPALSPRGLAAPAAGRGSVSAPALSPPGLGAAAGLGRGSAIAPPAFSPPRGLGGAGLPSGRGGRRGSGGVAFAAACGVAGCDMLF